ncbi:MAG: LamG domain-containing protein [Planctomycetota bacterium]|jgi:hypothetical protein
MSQKLIYLVCFVVVLSMAGQASAELILHWRFDEGSGDTVNDSSGNGRVGTIEGATWTVDDKGPCLEFGGDGDYVIDDDAGSYLNGLSALSVAMWIKSDVIGTDSGFIIFENPQGRDTRNIRYDQDMGGGLLNGIKYGACVNPGDTDDDEDESPPDVQTTEWQHIVVTWASGDGAFPVGLNLYIDGVLQTPSTDEPSAEGVLTDYDRVLVGKGGKDDGDTESWDGLIDDVRIYDHVLSEVEILGAMEGTVWPYAIGPVPADGSYHEDTWVNLSWSPGSLAVSHDVYLGDNFDAVSEGAEGTFIGNQADTFLVAGFPGFPYPDGLVPGTTYYWRIDEVNDADPNSPWKGDVWSFMMPPKTAYLPDPADNGETVAVNANLSWTQGFGAKLHTVYFGDNFDDVNNAAGGLPQGAATYDPGELKQAKTYYWRVDEFDAFGTYKGNVWSFITEGAVAALDPANGAVDVTQTPVLTWAPGLGATHEVYFGADPASLELKGSGNLGSESYDAGSLEWNTTYYWRVDEANNANADSPWTGPLWSFTTANFLIIDDFEAYNDIEEGQPGSNRLYIAWADGYDNPAINGSVVGNDPPPIAELTVVHGGLQSMPMTYNNAAGKSEATLTLTDKRDWTVNGVTTLTIWYRGDSANTAEQMYVTLNGNARVDHDDPDATLKTSWTRWDIDLQAFGVNLANVNSITLGLSSGSGGTGIMYFDDIRLSAP